MAKLRSRRWSDVSAARRAFVSALALCLFALQAFVAASLVRAHDASAAGVSASAYCEPHRDGAPPAEREHAPCCILCVSGRDLPSLAEPPSEEPILAPPVAFAFVAYASTAPPRRVPVGWASSWSSRAPPLA
ncbi:hypothetical protein [Methylosinus sporium]|uniref:hypothetical protein n=1 Tax=Methylosinus sporium TaxID=428 RepID=UPI00383A04A1